MSVALEQRVRVLESQLRVANAEIAKLRRRLNESGRMGKRLDRAYADALLLAQLHIGFQPTSRRAAWESAGVSHNRWENAIALLRLARCHNGHDWMHHDLATIEERLGKAKDVALDSPEAYRARLPKHIRSPIKG